MNTGELIVDGMLSGTGVRDATNGGYVSLSDLKITENLSYRINKWVSDYETVHFLQYKDIKENEELDMRGIQLAKELQIVLDDLKIRYFSNWLMKELHF